MLSSFTCASCADTLELGPTTFVLIDDVQPWGDLPEVMIAMRSLEQNKMSGEAWESTSLHIPPSLFEGHVILYTAHTPLSVENAVCQYTHGGNIEARVIGESAYNSCLAHEYAHKWVWLTQADKECTEADVHDCEGWMIRERILKYAACRGGWEESNRDCENYNPKLLKSD